MSEGDTPMRLDRISRDLAEARHLLDVVQGSRPGTQRDAALAEYRAVLRRISADLADLDAAGGMDFLFDDGSGSA